MLLFCEITNEIIDSRGSAFKILIPYPNRFGSMFRGNGKDGYLFDRKKCGKRIYPPKQVRVKLEFYMEIMKILLPIDGLKRKIIIR